eukprot:TRINITY_DN56608_c0_g1_i1.p1 TRINITY_DN56608_c0_g1~~TRINITY_DN56608_c0_g1_i1.p1  ORF type:complete len:257 (-),score=38.38 TRINITY_DN56608_c0_g1_i1:320-1000(-)
MFLPRLLGSRQQEHPKDVKPKQRSTLVERTRQLEQSSCVCSMANWEECYSMLPHCAETMCCICLAGISEDSRIRGLGCGHVFHLECVAEWFMKDKSLELACPLCRVPLAKQPPIEKQCTSHALCGAGLPSTPRALAFDEVANPRAKFRVGEEINFHSGEYPSLVAVLSLEEHHLQTGVHPNHVAAETVEEEDNLDTDEQVKPMMPRAIRFKETPDFEISDFDFVQL